MPHHTFYSHERYYYMKTKAPRTAVCMQRLRLVQRLIQIIDKIVDRFNTH